MLLASKTFDKLDSNRDGLILQSEIEEELVRAKRREGLNKVMSMALDEKRRQEEEEEDENRLFILLDSTLLIITAYFPDYACAGEEVQAEVEVIAAAAIAL